MIHPIERFINPNTGLFKKKYFIINRFYVTKVVKVNVLKIPKNQFFPHRLPEIAGSIENETVKIRCKDAHF